MGFKSPGIWYKYDIKVASYLRYKYTFITYIKNQKYLEIKFSSRSVFKNIILFFAKYFVITINRDGKFATVLRHDFSNAYALSKLSMWKLQNNEIRKYK